MLEWHRYMSFLKIKIDCKNSIRENVFKKMYNGTEKEYLEELKKISSELDKTAVKLQQKRTINKIKKCILLTRNIN